MARLPEGGTTEGTSSPQHNAISKGADNVVAQIPTEKERQNISTDKLEARSSQLEAAYKVYNIGNSSPVPLMEYIAAIEKALGKEAQKEFLPMQPGDVPRTEADVTDLMEDMNYKPDTPVQAGIEKFIEWYRLYFNGR